MGFADAEGRVIEPTLQGGISSIYYAGSLLGGFLAGWFSDRYGRIKGIWVACAFCATGVVLQTAAVDLASILVARIIAGVGVAFLLVIAPSWTAELSPAAHRGDTIAMTFLANFSGITLAAWLGYGEFYSLCKAFAPLNVCQPPRSTTTGLDNFDGDFALRAKSSQSS